MPDDDPVKRLYETIGKAMEKLGMRAKLAAELEPYLHEAGCPLGRRLFEALEIPEAEVEVTLAMAREGLEDPDVHRYFNFYFWYAQKPGLQTEQGLF
ncbi:hypothetical protein E4U23_005259 [Claviceps purpurea]|nr:hypothetical protein E4U23_005259 [Claviceps purpurea]